MIATHSPIIAALPHAQIYSLSNEGIQSVGYEATDCFLVVKEFLESRQSRPKR